jgi:putative Mn2+ efflux pump MntP
MWQAVVLSFGLAMDSASVSAARGLGQRRRELVILPLIFGGFQAAMAALGWLLGALAGPIIGRWDHWVAFAVLALIGAKMILEAVSDDGGAATPPGGLRVYLRLGLATSVDAAAAGLALPLVPVEPWLVLTLIGGVTAACSAVAFASARTLGGRLGRRLDIAGGVVLIGIGVEILVSGLRS